VITIKNSQPGEKNAPAEIIYEDKPSHEKEEVSIIKGPGLSLSRFIPNRKRFLAEDNRATQD